MGATGAGKSSTCNTICGKEHFHTSDSLNTHTYETKGLFTNWFNDRANERILLIDTPGLGDSDGRDTQHIAEMISSLQAIGYVSVFLICVNS